MTPGHGRISPIYNIILLKRFTGKMPLCKYLIINEIKYFLKFFAIFLQLMKIAVTLHQS